MNDTRRRKLRGARTLLREAAGIIGAEIAQESDEVARFRLVQSRQASEHAIAAINIALGPEPAEQPGGSIKP